MIICMQCGADNPRGGNLCRSCQATLPRMDTSSMLVGDKIVGRYNQFKEAVAKVKEGAWSTEEFFEFLQSLYGFLSEKRLGTEQLIAESGYEEYGEEEVRQGRDGMNHFEMGMQEMALFLEDGDLQHLDEGLSILWRGNEFINDAMRINRAERRKLEDEWGWM